LQKLAAIREKERSVDFKLANFEQSALVEEIIKKGGGIDFKQHLEKIGRMKNQKVAQFAYFQNTFNIAREKNIPLSKYTNLIHHWENLKEFSEIDLGSALEEMEKLEDEVYVAHLSSPRSFGGDQSKAGPRQEISGTTTDDARLLRPIDRYLALLQTAYEIRMSAKEFDLFKMNEPDFGTVSYLAFINRKLMELGYAGDLIAYKNVLEEGKKTLEAFYDAVRRRDLVFMEKTQTVLERENQQVAVLIAGGYHTDHLKKLFGEKGYSYAVLAPVITSETNQARYESLLLEPLRQNPKPAEAAGNPKTYEVLKRGETSPGLAELIERAVSSLEPSKRPGARLAAAEASLKILRPAPIMTRRDFLKAAAVGAGAAALKPGELLAEPTQAKAAQEKDTFVEFAVDKTKGIVKVKVGGKVLEKEDLTAVVYQTTAPDRHISVYAQEGRIHELLAQLLPIKEGGKDLARIFKEEMRIKNIRLYYLPLQNADDIRKTKEILNRVHQLYGIRVMAGHWAGLWNLPGSPELSADTP
ncbi:MAG: twin-arginine translocation signal domain-containing protein, partial [Candidatus Omnitrophota bacterium]